jgi:hypothetical protein
MPFDGVDPDAVRRVWNWAGLLDSTGLAILEYYNPWIPLHVKALRYAELEDRIIRVSEDIRTSIKKETYLRTQP